MNAHALWGSSCDTTAAECNGDGDEKIEYTAAGTQDVEAFRAQQHLYLSGIMSFDASGYATTAGVGVIGTNILASSVFDKVGYTIFYDGALYSGSYKRTNSILIGASDSSIALNSSFKFPRYAALTPRQAYMIDVKIDDGISVKGKFWAGNGWDGSAWMDCRDDATSYNLDENSKQCAPSYTID